jgi:hypothetical protein
VEDAVAVSDRKARGDDRSPRPNPPEGPPLFAGANHICIVTNDLDGAVRRWWDRYRVGPWRVFTYGHANMDAAVDGQPLEFKMRAALAQLGPNFRIEIIQPMDEQGPYADSLRRNGNADHLHHVRLDVPEFARTKDELAALDLPVRLDATFRDASGNAHPVRAMYFDTSGELGFLLEIGDAPPGFSMPDPDYVYPPTD